MYLIAETGLVTDRLRVREIDDDEGQRLVRIVCPGSGSVVVHGREEPGADQSELASSLPAGTLPLAALSSGR